MIRSITADNSRQLTSLINELGLKKENIIQIVWMGNQFALFYETQD